MAREGLVIQK